MPGKVKISMQKHITKMMEEAQEDMVQKAVTSAANHLWKTNGEYPYWSMEFHHQTVISVPTGFAVPYNLVANF